MEKTGINKKRRKYDESFKMELLKMVKSGRSVAEVSRTMGIGENLLYKWRSEENGQEKPVELEINTEIEHLRKQLKQAEIERDILKKSDRRSGLSYFRSGNVTKTYEIVLELSLSYQVRLLCTILDISFSSFYAWKRAETHVMSQTKVKLTEQVKEVFEEHRKRYGAIRISKELQAQGVKIGRHQARTLMKKQGLVAIQPKSFVPKTTNSNHNFGRSPNLLLERVAPTTPNEVFVGEITYIALEDGSWLYLATWQDMFSRKIVGWDLAENMRSILIINALNKAIKQRKLPKGLIVHSDGGGQYASDDFRNLLKKYDFLQSMTRKDNHYDNAMGESDRRSVYSVDSKQK